ncbi:hypothetical protein [Cognatiyoonia sp.]
MSSELSPIDRAKFVAAKRAASFVETLRGASKVPPNDFEVMGQADGDV